MDGFILIDKPAGITSHDAVDAVRRVAKTRRVGHAGTLDPFATGLLIMGIGKATKKLGELVGLDKTYEATAHLGATSTTDDPEGLISVGAAQRVAPNQDEVNTTLRRFLGSYEQTAPAFSAKKVGGKKLYELARQGRMHEVELPKKNVTITGLAILDYAWPDLRFRVSCSSGTYIRALARDLGQALGTGAYLTQLRRTRIGPYRVEDAVQLAKLTPQILEQKIQPRTTALTLLH